MVTVTGTGVLAVGEYEPTGLKLQLAPAGSPVQLRDTLPAKAPAAVKLTEAELEVEPANADTEVGEGAVIPKSTTRNVSDWLLVTLPAPVPEVAETVTL